MQAPSAPHAPFPERVGKYELLLPIGTGGMATVYLARTPDPELGERRVALKLVHAHLRADEESKLHLLEEAKLAALIRHPNVISVVEVDEDPFGVFLVMEYVEGETLSGLVRLARSRSHPLSRRLMARILNDALLGLHAAHELRDPTGKALNLVHRDFSPQNILLGVDGQVRLGDFGVAKAADRAVRTKTGLTKGKIAYMSPEQARGHAVDRRCDVWAAGVVAWELLAGERLHKSDDDVATLLSIVTEKPPRLRTVQSDVPQALDDAIAWALEPQLSRRCPTADEFRHALIRVWEAGDGMADPTELATFVSEVTQQSLRERNRRVESVLRARQNAPPQSSPISSQRSELASGPVLLEDVNAPAPAAPASRVEQFTPRTERSARRDEQATRRDASSTSDPAFAATRAAVDTSLSSPGHARPANQADDDDQSEIATRVIPDAERQLRARSANPLETGRREDLTETSAVVPTLEQPRGRNRWALVVGAVLGAAGSLAIAWLLRPPAPEPARNASAEAAAAREGADQLAPASASEPKTEPGQAVGETTERERSATVPESERSARVPESDETHAAPSAPRKATRSKPVQGVKGKPTAPAKKREPRDKPKLATSPYGEPKSGH